MQKIIPFKKEVSFKDNVSEITSISLEHSLRKEAENEIAGEFIVSGEYKIVDTTSVLDRFSYELPFSIHMDEKYNIDKAQIDIDDFYYEVINNNTLSIHIDVLIDRVEEKVLEEVRSIESEDEVEENISIPEVIVEEEVNEMTEDDNTIRESTPTIEPAKVPCEERAEVPSVEVVTTVEEAIPAMEEIAPAVTSVAPAISSRPSVEEDIRIDTVDTISSIFDKTGESSYSTYRVYIVREEDTLESVMEKYTISRDLLEKYNDLKEIKKGDKLIIPCTLREKV